MITEEEIEILKHYPPQKFMFITDSTYSYTYDKTTQCFYMTDTIENLKVKDETLVSLVQNLIRENPPYNNEFLMALKHALRSSRWENEMEEVINE